MQVFSTVEENLEKRNFKIYISGKYEPNLPKMFINENLPPFYQDIDNWAHSFVPPVAIIDMCFQEVDFSIPDIEDMETIIFLIQSYVDKASLIDYKPVKLINFLEKCEIALEKIKTSHYLFKRFLRNKYPDRYQEENHLLEHFKSYDEVK